MREYLTYNVDITKLSNFKTPARSKYYFEIHNEDQIELLWKIFAWAETQDIPILIVSWGTNMLFAFDEYNGIIVHNRLAWWTYDRSTCQLSSYGSESIWDIASKLEQDYSQSIWHRFIWLPWSVAWAIYGNAGCFWLETQNNFVSCRVLNTETGAISVFSKNDMDFSYRSSILKKEKKYFLISALFDLSKVVEKYSSDVDNVYFREHVQPQWNSCGSFFKNPIIDRDAFVYKFPEIKDITPKNISAWFLLEQAGLKWYTYGWAFFSQKHANFLMHNGNGCWQDIVYLIALAQERVSDQFWIDLENEVQILT